MNWKDQRKSEALTSGTTVLWIRSMSLELHCLESWQRSDCDHKNSSMVSYSLLVPRHKQPAGVLLRTDIFPSLWSHCSIYKPGADLIPVCMSVGWMQDEGFTTCWTWFFWFTSIRRKKKKKMVLKIHIPLAGLQPLLLSCKTSYVSIMEGNSPFNYEYLKDGWHSKDQW